MNWTVKILISFFLIIGVDHHISGQEGIIAEIDQILTDIDTLETDSLKVWTLFHLSGRKYRYARESRRLLDRADQLIRGLDDEVLRSNYLYAMGNFYYYNSMLDSSAHYLDEALAREAVRDDPFLHSQILATQSSLQEMRGNVAQSFQTILQAKEILVTIDTLSLSESDRVKRKGQISILDNSIGILYKSMDDYEMAILYYNEAYNLLLELGNSTSAGVVMGNIGELYLSNDKLDESLKALEQSLELKQIGGMPDWSVALTQFNIGRANKMKGNLDTALVKFNEAIGVFEKEHYLDGLMEAYIERGLLFFESGEFAASERDCQDGLRLAMDQSNANSLSRACECLYRVNKQAGNIATALDYYEQHNVLKDSLFNAENVKQLTQLEMQFNFDRERELQVLEANARQAEYQRVTRLLIIGTLVSLLIAFLLYYLFRLRKRANLILAQKNAQISKALGEKEVLLKEIHHRVKNNLQVISSLLSLQSRQLANPQAREAIQSGRNRVKSMALIHQNLYQDEDLVGVDTVEYIDKLTNNLVNSYKVFEKDIEIKTYVDSMKLDVDTLIPIGLILNELISNALKYAFNGVDDGVLEIHLLNQDNSIHLKVSDNGGGLPKNFAIENSKSLGYRLIKAFSEKLSAALTIEHSPAGTVISMNIPNPKIL